MNIVEVFGCESCGDVTLRARLAGVLAVDESGTVTTTARDVAERIGIELVAGRGVKLRTGLCWVCVTESDVSRETLGDDGEADGSQQVPLR